jgi:hypothetical protein
VPAVVPAGLLARPQPHRRINPIEEAFSKVKGILRKAKARTLDALFEATGEALGAVGKGDAKGFFNHCGYVATQDHSL